MPSPLQEVERKSAQARVPVPLEANRDSSCQRRRGRVLGPPPLLMRINEEVLGGFAAPGYAECGLEDVGGDLCETHASSAFFAPAAWDWGEDFWGVLYHAGLLVGGEE